MSLILIFSNILLLLVFFSMIFIEIKNVDESFLAAAIKDGSQATIILKGIKTNGPYIMAYDKKGFYKKRTSAKVKHENENFAAEIEKYITTST